MVSFMIGLVCGVVVTLVAIAVVVWRMEGALEDSPFKRRKHG